MKVQTRIDELITLRASEWFEILKNPTEAERATFIAWLSESRRHVQEFLELAAVDDAVGAMSPELRENLHELIERVAPAAVPLRPRARPQLWPRRAAGTPWKWVVLWSAACTVMVALVVWTGWRPGSHEVSTDIGEQRTVALADTSVITLNADSRIQWHLDEIEREIELRRGEALFKVAHDAARPFRVRTRAGVVQAIGTQFNVYARANGDTRVSVLEGRVQLTARNNAGTATAQTRVLKAGEEANIRLDGTIHRNANAAVDKTVAWRERRLAFSDTLLEDMVVEFNRYNRSPQLRLQGVPTGTYRFAGIFDAADPQSLADLLSREPDLVIEKGENEIVIRRTTAGDAASAQLPERHTLPD